MESSNLRGAPNIVAPRIWNNAEWKASVTVVRHLGCPLPEQDFSGSLRMLDLAFASITRLTTDIDDRKLDPLDLTAHCLCRAP